MGRVVVRLAVLNHTLQISDLRRAADYLRQGRIVAFPTETVFGLGADATNEAAIERVFAAKGRPSDNPLIVHLATADDWPKAARNITEDASLLLQRFAPGPLTVVLPRAPVIADSVCAGLDTVGIRIPDHASARELIRLSGKPIAAPSANLSGRPSCTRWKSVIEDLDGRIDAVFCEDSNGIGVESTVVDCTQSPVVMLRPGAISLSDIRSVCPSAIAFNERPPSDLNRVASPGVLHPHYQPRAEVQLFDDAEGLYELLHQDVSSSRSRIAVCGLESELSEGFADRSGLTYLRVFPTSPEYARHFYEFLREADRRNCDRVLVQRSVGTGCDPKLVSGVEAALLDRQTRAAADDRS